MRDGKIDSIDSYDYSSYDYNSFQSSNPEEFANKPGLALHEVFNKDVLESPFLEGASFSPLKEATNSSFWRKIFFWWYESQTKVQEAKPSSSKSDLVDPNDVENSTNPDSDKDETIPVESEAKVSSAKKENQNIKLTPKELGEGLSLMNDKTIEQIFFIILKAQIELEKETANVSEKTMLTYEDFKKFQEKELARIQDLLAKDERVAGHFRTVQNLTFAATIVCGLCAASSKALTPVVGAAIGATFGATIQEAFVKAANFLGSVGPLVSAGLTAIVLSGEAYHKRKHNEDKANHESLNHQDKFFDNRIDDTREHLMNIAETDNVFKERIANFIKRWKKMAQLIAQK